MDSAARRLLFSAFEAQGSDFTGPLDLSEDGSPVLPLGPHPPAVGEDRAQVWLRGQKVDVVVGADVSPVGPFRLGLTRGAPHEREVADWIRTLGLSPSSPLAAVLMRGALSCLSSGGEGAKEGLALAGVDLSPVRTDDLAMGTGIAPYARSPHFRTSRYARAGLVPGQPAGAADGAETGTPSGLAEGGSKVWLQGAEYDVACDDPVHGKLGLNAGDDPLAVAQAALERRGQGGDPAETLRLAHAIEGTLARASRGGQQTADGCQAAAVFPRDDEPKSEEQRAIDATALALADEQRRSEVARIQRQMATERVETLRKKRELKERLENDRPTARGGIVTLSSLRAQEPPAPTPSAGEGPGAAGTAQFVRQVLESAAKKSQSPSQSQQEIARLFKLLAVNALPEGELDRLASLSRTDPRRMVKELHAMGFTDNDMGVVIPLVIERSLAAQSKRPHADGALLVEPQSASGHKLSEQNDVNGVASPRGPHVDGVEPREIGEYRGDKAGSVTMRIRLPGSGKVVPLTADRTTSVAQLYQHVAWLNRRHEIDAPNFVLKCGALPPRVLAQSSTSTLAEEKLDREVIQVCKT
eukprot:m51a1_g11751 hypothetical protein (584) ;mRNA; f:191224-193552